MVRQMTRPITSKVVGYPPGQSWSPYELCCAHEGCQDDEMASNDSVSNAHPLGVTSVCGGVVCCDDDWFSFSLGSNQNALIEASVASGTWRWSSTIATARRSSLLRGPPRLLWSRLSRRASHLLPACSRDHPATYDLEGSSAEFSNTVRSRPASVSNCFSDSSCPNGYACIDTYRRSL